MTPNPSSNSSSRNPKISSKFSPSSKPSPSCSAFSSAVGLKNPAIGLKNLQISRRLLLVSPRSCSIDWKSKSNSVERGHSIDGSGPSVAADDGTGSTRGQDLRTLGAGGFPFRRVGLSSGRFSLLDRGEQFGFFRFLDCFSDFCAAAAASRRACPILSRISAGDITYQPPVSGKVFRKLPL